MCQQIWKTQQWPQDWKGSDFILIPKKGNARKCSNYHEIALNSHASKVMLKILQAWRQLYRNWELPDVQAGFRKGRGNRDQIANIHGSQKKQESSRKTSTSASLTMLKPFTVWITTNWEILKEMGIPDHLTCLLRNLETLSMQLKEAIVRTGHGTTDWFKTGKAVCHPAYLTDMQSTSCWTWGTQARIKIVGRNINNLRYAYDTTLMAESKEELKSLLMKVKE